MYLLKKPSEDIVTAMKPTNMSYTLLTQLMRLLVGVALILSMFLWYLLAHPSMGRVYAVDVNGGSKSALETINYPGENVAYVRHWVNDTLTSLFTFTSLNYLDNLNSLRYRFSSSGFRNFRSAFVSNDLVKNAVANDSSVYSVVNTNQVLDPNQFLFVRKGVWSIDVPVFISSDVPGLSADGLQSANTDRITVTIEKVPAIEAPMSGLKIQSIILRKDNG